MSLRRIHERDAPLVVRWRNDPDIAHQFFAVDEVTEQSHLNWCRRNQGSTTDFTFVIHDDPTLTPVGMVGVYNVDLQASKAEFGRLLIAPQYRGQGKAKEACRLVIRLGLQELGLGELYLRVWTDNLPAISLYESLGFVAVSVELDEERGRSVTGMRLTRQSL